MSEYNNNQPQYLDNDPFQPAGPEGKSRGVAGLLAILIGGLGIHYFYINKTTGGIYCILLTLVTCGLWSTITLVQGILFLTMTNQEFENKFVLSQSEFPVF